MLGPSPPFPAAASATGVYGGPTTAISPDPDEVPSTERTDASGADPAGDVGRGALLPMSEVRIEASRKVRERATGRGGGA